MRAINGLNGHWSFPMQHPVGNTGPASWILRGTWICENTDYMIIFDTPIGPAYRSGSRSRGGSLEAENTRSERT